MRVKPRPPLDPDEVLQHFRRRRGLLSIESKITVRDEYMLGRIYVPGVAEPCRAIQEDPATSFTYSMRGNAVGILTDGSSVLSYGDAGPLAALPVMEGKAVLFKALAGVNAFPIAVSERDPARLARMPSCTRGPRHCSIIRTSTALFRGEG